MSTTNQINIIDGYNGGVAHIEAAMIRDHNISLYGTGDYVLNVGNKFAHEIVNNNNITIKDGMAVMGGARVSIGYGKTKTAVIENGTSGYKRHDLIVLEYNLDNATLIETAELKVVKGELGTSGVDPDLVTGDIRAGATVHQMPLKRVKLNGLNIEAVEDMFDSNVYPVNLESLLNIGCTSITKLWENASPTSEFPAQSITIPAVANGDIIGVETGSCNRIYWFKAESGKTYTMNDINFSSDSASPYMIRRDVKLNSLTTLNFRSGYYRYIDGSNVQSDIRLVPLTIYVIKGVA